MPRRFLSCSCYRGAYEKKRSTRYYALRTMLPRLEISQRRVRVTVARNLYTIPVCRYELAQEIV